MPAPLPPDSVERLTASLRRLVLARTWQLKALFIAPNSPDGTSWIILWLSWPCESSSIVMPCYAIVFCSSQMHSRTSLFHMNQGITPGTKIPTAACLTWKCSVVTWTKYWRIWLCAPLWSRLRSTWHATWPLQSSAFTLAASWGSGSSRVAFKSECMDRTRFPTSWVCSRCCSCHSHRTLAMNPCKSKPVFNALKICWEEYEVIQSCKRSSLNSKK